MQGLHIDIIMLDLSFVVCSQKHAPFSNCSVVIVLMHYGYTGIKYSGDSDCHYQKELRAFQGWTSIND